MWLRELQVPDLADDSTVIPARLDLDFKLYMQ